MNWQTYTANKFDRLEDALSVLIPQWFINGSLRLVFSKTSLLLHTAWFALWFIGGFNIGLLTNIVSLEAIYVGVLIGIQQIKHHKERHKK